MKKTLPIQILAAAVLLTGCETSGQTAGLTGLLAGGACAALGGSAGDCIALGSAVAALTYVISEELDERDRETYAKAQAEAAASRQAVTMVSPETGNTIKFEPTSDFADEDGAAIEFTNDAGQTCAKYDVEYIKESKPFKEKQTMCEVAPGDWQKVD